MFYFFIDVYIYIYIYKYTYLLRIRDIKINKENVVRNVAITYYPEAVYYKFEYKIKGSYNVKASTTNVQSVDIFFKGREKLYVVLKVWNIKLQHLWDFGIMHQWLFLWASWYYHRMPSAMLNSFIVKKLFLYIRR